MKNKNNQENRLTKLKKKKKNPSKYNYMYPEAAWTY
jgi:hypothetical protein